MYSYSALNLFYGHINIVKILIWNANRIDLNVKCNYINAVYNKYTSLIKNSLVSLKVNKIF